MVETRRSVGQLRLARTQSRPVTAKEAARTNGPSIYHDDSSVANSDGDDEMEEASGGASQEAETDQGVRVSKSYSLLWFP